jgi:hypothetical protein
MRDAEDGRAGGILADEDADGYVFTNSEAPGAQAMTTRWMLSDVDQSGQSVRYYATSQPPADPGDLLGRIKLNLNGCAAGSVIPLSVVTAAGNAGTQLYSPSNATEIVGAGLSVVDGSITIPPGTPTRTPTPTKTPKH